MDTKATRAKGRHGGFEHPAELIHLAFLDQPEPLEYRFRLHMIGCPALVVLPTATGSFSQAVAGSTAGRKR